MKRIISMIVLLSVMLVVKTDKTYGANFSDTNKHWASEAIDLLSEKKLGYYEKEYTIISGYSNGTFQPENFISRAETMKMIASYELSFGTNWLNREMRDGELPEDLDQDKYNWTNWELVLSPDYAYMSGYSDGTFRPENKITRAEFVKVVCNQLEKSNTMPKKNKNTNLKDIRGHWAENEISDLSSRGIINGYGDEFKPENKITRAEAASIMAKMSLRYGYNEKTSNKSYLKPVDGVDKAAIKKGYMLVDDNDKDAGNGKYITKRPLPEYGIFDVKVDGKNINMTTTKDQYTASPVLVYALGNSGKVFKTKQEAIEWANIQVSSEGDKPWRRAGYTHYDILQVQQDGDLEEVHFSNGSYFFSNPIFGYTVDFRSPFDTNGFERDIYVMNRYADIYSSMGEEYRKIFFERTDLE